MLVDVLSTPCMQVKGVLGTLVDVLSTPLAEVQQMMSMASQHSECMLR